MSPVIFPKQRASTITKRTKDYRQVLWLPPESQYYHKFPYLQGTVGHLYGDCHHSWDVFESHLVWLTGPLRHNGVTGCQCHGITDRGRNSRKRIWCPCFEEILLAEDSFKWLRGIRLPRLKESEPYNVTCLASVLCARWLCSNGSKWSKSIGPDAK